MSAVHRVPVIDRMVDVLTQLEQTEGGLGIKELASRCGVPRTTVYRILNTLEAHRIVVRAGQDGGYQLGSRLVTLATRVPSGAGWQRLAAWSQPWLDRLAAESNETVKLSVLDGDAALCIGVAQGGSESAVAARIGGRYPLHAGAASKVLLSAIQEEARARLWRDGLRAYTDRTITDAASLNAQLAEVARQGWAEDAGEYSLSVRAVAAPVRERHGRIVAAISIVCFPDRADRQWLAYREAVRHTARQMSQGLSM